MIMEGAMDIRDPRSSPSSESKLKLFIISCLKINKQNKHKKKKKRRKTGVKGKLVISQLATLDRTLS